MVSVRPARARRGRRKAGRQARAVAEWRGVRPGLATGRKTPREFTVQNGAVTRMPGMITRWAEFVEGMEVEVARGNPHFR